MLFLRSGKARLRAEVRDHKPLTTRCMKRPKHGWHRHHAVILLTLKSQRLERFVPGPPDPTARRSSRSHRRTKNHDSRMPGALRVFGLGFDSWHWPQICTKARPSRYGRRTCTWTRTQTLEYVQTFRPLPLSLSFFPLRHCCRCQLLDSDGCGLRASEPQTSIRKEKRWTPGPATSGLLRSRRHRP